MFLQCRNNVYVLTFIVSCLIFYQDSVTKHTILFLVVNQKINVPAVF